MPYTFWHTTEPTKEGLVQSALLPYRHELLLENGKDIPVLQQHGSADDNVPVYNARLMSQRIHQSGAYSEYFEVPGRSHFWKGVMATKPLSHFINEQLDRHMEEKTANVPLHLLNFTIVVADPGDMGSKNGLKVLNLQNQGKLGKVSLLYDPLTRACAYHTVNVWNFFLPPGYLDCSWTTIDGIPTTLARVEHGNILHKSDNGWTLGQSHRPNIRTGRQNGNMDAILRTLGTFSIVTHSAGVERIALQISRNLCQYYNADTDITSNYTSALSKPGNIVSVAVGGDLPQLSWDFAIQVDEEGLSIDYYVAGRVMFFSSYTPGLAATFLRPLPDGRLELVVWAAEQSGLSTAARLVPMLTGSGQPDFVVADRDMLRKGVEGTLALGFYDSFWDVAPESYLAF